MSYNPPPNPSTWNTQTSASNLRQDDPSQNISPNPRTILTRDEIRVLKECNAESFYYRCIPLSTLFSGLAYIGMKNGYLQKSSRYGYVPKMLFGVVGGYIGGKFSYQSACAEKMMRLPNSSLADALRKRRGITSFQESIANEPGFSYGGSEFQKDNFTVDERNPDLSEHEEGIDSYNTVKESLSPYSQNEDWKNQKTTSYDELRRENREDHFSKLSERYRKQSPDPNRPANSSTPASFPGSSFSESSEGSGRFSDDHGSKLESSPDFKREPYFNPKKNKYGDLWDD